MDEHTIKMAMAAMTDRNSVAHEVAKRLNITTTTLYTYVNGDGSLKEAGTRLLIQSTRERLNGETDTHRAVSHFT